MKKEKLLLNYCYKSAAIDKDFETNRVCPQRRHPEVLTNPYTKCQVHCSEGVLVFFLHCSPESSTAAAAIFEHSFFFLPNYFKITKPSTSRSFWVTGSSNCLIWGREKEKKKKLFPENTPSPVWRGWTGKDAFQRVPNQRTDCQSAGVFRQCWRAPSSQVRDTGGPDVESLGRKLDVNVWDISWTPNTQKSNSYCTCSAWGDGGGKKKKRSPQADSITGLPSLWRSRAEVCENNIVFLATLRRSNARKCSTICGVIFWTCLIVQANLR